MSQEIDWMNPKGQHYFNMDCMEGMKMMPDKCMDLAIVDPPYGIGDVAAFTPRKSNCAKNKIHKETSWNANTPPMEYWQELFRVSVNQIVWGANYMTESLPISRGWIFWDKGYDKTNNFSAGELAWTSFDTVLKKIEIIHRILPHMPSNIHPTQKPMALYRWLVKNYAKQGDKILDTHVGSASSLVVYEEMGFEYVGFELDPDYYRDSCKRLEAFRAQPKLFSGGEIFQASKLPEQGKLF